jgi:ubiquinone/menaquinone biosynthesis C-methylase UbiE
MDAYYDRRAPEYDDWYVGSGLFARLARPGWEEDLAALEATVAALPAARTLDVACGTGWLTRHLAGPVTGLDQSAAMLAIARERVPEAELVQGDGLALPFADGAFERIFTGHFYGHLQEAERSAFLAEARRVARELVVVDAAERPDEPPEAWQERTLRDGSRHRVYKRFFRPDDLVRELGGGRVLYDGPWFVVVATP